MGVDRLPLGRNQPFFNVLAEDKSTRYAADGRCQPVPLQQCSAIPQQRSDLLLWWLAITYPVLTALRGLPILPLLSYLLNFILIFTGISPVTDVCFI